MKKYAKMSTALLLAATMIFSTGVNAFATVTGEVTTGTDASQSTQTPATTDSNTATEGTTDNSAAASGTDSSAGTEVVVTENDKPYLALGQDLSAEQRSTVLSLLGVDEGKLADYDVAYVTNAEEHQYLDTYISSDKIGTKSLSSAVVIKGEKGSGIAVTTKNISYCTQGMYQNALATAGISDAQVIVAGPTAISGTAALVGIFKAYETMTGDNVSEDSVDAALNEIVITGEIANDSASDSDQIEGLVALVKENVVANGLDDEASIGEAIDKASEDLDVTLTEDQKAKLVDLMSKISDLDLDSDTLQEQAGAIYDKVSELLGDQSISDAISDFAGNVDAGSFFTKLLNKIKEWLAGLMG